MKKKILIIDDDKDVLNLLLYCMQEEYLITTAINGQSGLKKMENEHFSLVILDIMLPGMNGLDTLRAIRKKYNIPVIMLTAKDSVEDKVLGLEIGADDYLTKPFEIKELIARVGSLVRRNTVLNTGGERSDILVCKYFTLDSQKKCVIREGKEIFLTGKEFGVLFFLASSPGKVYTKKQIYVNVWGDDYCYDDDNIMAVISRIRTKIGKDANRQEYIETIRGVGYRFRAQD